eukprot:9468811-Karenia_brevis.AAC.1
MARLKQRLDAQQSTDQAGFRPGFATEDHLFVWALLAEKCREWRQDLWICTVDYQKAFDTVKHDAIWAALRNQEVPESYITLLRKLYSDSTGQVCTSKSSRTFRIQKGVKQGDPFSPLLFNSVLEGMFRVLKARWKIQKRGINIDGASLTNLRFADDVLLTARSLAELRAMIGDLIEVAASVGLQIHPDKTKVLTNINKHRPSKVEVSGKQIAVITSDGTAKYLGRLIGLQNMTDIEVDNRLKLAWKRFHAQTTVLANKAYSLNQRLKLFDSTVTPVLLYGSVAWTVTAEVKAKLRKAQRRMLRSIYGAGRKRLEMNLDSSSSSSTSSSGSSLAASDKLECLEP